MSISEPAATLAGNVSPDLTTLRKRWFDCHLKGERNGVEDEPTVRIFVMGGGTGRRNAAGRMDHGGRWRTERDWPLPGTRNTPYFLTAEGQLVESEPRSKHSKRTFNYDPRHPVPTIGGTVTSGQPLMVGGAFDQREAPQFYGSQQPGRALADRPDVLVFQTPPLAADVEVTGAIEADLWISSNCPDTDFTIKLLDVYPPSEDYPHGFAMNLTDGILRCRYRDSWERPAMLRPGKLYKIRVSAFPTSNLFVAGHRIRLDVSSSNFPHFDVNPNTGEPEGRWRHTRVATNTIFMDASSSFQRVATSDSVARVIVACRPKKSPAPAWLVRGFDHDRNRVLLLINYPTSSSAYGPSASHGADGRAAPV